MTTATDNTISLTPEQRAGIQRAVGSHLLSLKLAEGKVEDNLASSKPDLVAIDQLARKLQLSVNVAIDVAEIGLLRLDQEGLFDLLSECEVEEEESADYYRDSGDNDPDELAIIRGRAAMLRVIRDLVRTRGQRAAEEGDE